MEMKDAIHPPPEEPEEVVEISPYKGWGALAKKAAAISLSDRSKGASIVKGIKLSPDYDIISQLTTGLAANWGKLGALFERWDGKDVIRIWHVFVPISLLAPASVGTVCCCILPTALSYSAATLETQSSLAHCTTSLSTYIATFSSLSCPHIHLCNPLGPPPHFAQSITTAQSAARRSDLQWGSWACLRTQKRWTPSLMRWM